MRSLILGLAMSVAATAAVGAATPASAQTTLYQQKLNYVGMSCARVQRDSIAYPANEVFLHVSLVSKRTGQAIGIPLPSGDKPYTKVTAGFRTKAGARPLWQGKQQDISMQVVMFEHDSGAATAELASDILLNLAMAVYGPNAPSDGEATKVRDVEHGGQFLRGLNRALGTGNDPMGTVQVNLKASDWSRAELRETLGFRYHFATLHRKNGAYCRAYFRFYPGETYRVAQQSTPAARPPDRYESGRQQDDYPPQELRPEDGPYVAEPPPAPTTRPIPRPARKPNYGYRVGIRNRCSEAISVAYIYFDENDAWTKRGWRTIKPGKTQLLNHYVGAADFAIHSTIGFPTGTQRTGRRDNEAIDNDPFDAPVGTDLSGEGQRTVPFEFVEWKAHNFKPVVDIDYCGSYRWGVRTQPVQTKPAQTKPAILPYTTSVTSEPAAKPEPASAPVPKPAEAGETRCVDLSKTSENEHERFRQLEARGLAKICEEG